MEPAFVGSIFIIVNKRGLYISRGRVVSVK